MVFGNQLLDLIMDKVPQAHIIIPFLMNFRFILVWLVFTLLFAAIYAYIPDKKLRFKEQLQGASFAAVLWSVYSWGFSLYVGWTGSYSVYGSLSIIVIVMIWMYFCMYIILIGAYVNLYFQAIGVDGKQR
jgi:membrane protein